jgi:hypothetical protein
MLTNYRWQLGMKRESARNALNASRPSADDSPESPPAGGIGELRLEFLPERPPARRSPDWSVLLRKKPKPASSQSRRIEEIDGMEDACRRLLFPSGEWRCQVSSIE